jgi:hypothetical protein
MSGRCDHLDCRSFYLNGVNCEEKQLSIFVDRCPFFLEISLLRAGKIWTGSLIVDIPVNSKTSTPSAKAFPDHTFLSCNNEIK